MWSRKFTWHDKPCEMRVSRGLDLLPEAKSIREDVFVKEQGFVGEFDEIDPIAKHCVIFVDGTPAATGRLYSDKGQPFEAHIGRLAVIKEQRGSGLGSLLMSVLETLAREDDCKKVILSAQCRAEGFYRANGYIPEGEVYYDEHCPHIKMFKQL